MAIESVSQAKNECARDVEKHYAFDMVVAPHGTLLVNGDSSHADRQNLASCILDAAKRLSMIDCEDHEASTKAWASAYLVSVAKGLLDSMKLGEVTPC